MTPSAAPALSLFISYSHEDDAWRARLDSHLALLKRQKVYDVWHDRRIGAGQEWAGRIDDALERADVVLLLVSSDFLDSEYCYDKELQRALARHEEGKARVVPVILRECEWQASDFCHLQAWPQDGRPITSFPNADEAMKEVASTLRRVATELRGDASAPHHLLGTAGARWRGRSRWVRAAVGSLSVLAAAVLAFGMVLKPALDEARNFMRRADYGSAAQALEALPGWARAWPDVQRLLAQAGFGVRLSRGEHITQMTPLLDDLARSFPRDADVLVFQGLLAYHADRDVEGAAELFRQAARADEAHLEARFLAVGRLVELAYQALGEGDDERARARATDARNLVEQARKLSPLGHVLPHHAGDIAELDELTGDAQAAHATHLRLAPRHPLSAAQAAMLSWRLPAPVATLRDGLEAVESATRQLDSAPADVVATEGWAFRVGPTELIDVRPKGEKLCLLGWVGALSHALQVPGPAAAAPPVPTACGPDAASRRIAEIVCVQVIGALHGLSGDDTRRAVLEDWRTQVLACAPGLQPLPTAPPATPPVDVPVS